MDPIDKHLLPESALRTVPSAKGEIAFGRTPTDHMLICDFQPERGGWQRPQIVPFGPFAFRPDALVFHYGQQIFEGLKAYRSVKAPTEALLFRPKMNARRMHNSALRLGMEPVPEELFLGCIDALVATDARWLMPSPCSLYVRPALIPLDEGVSYRASTAYRFFVILSPAKSYFDSASAGVAVWIERERVRAFPGGVGEAKCGGNYAGSVASLSEAKARGADHVLWLDARERKYVEEVGAMNIMFVEKGRKLITPRLSGSILPGVTRDSLLQLARADGFEISETLCEIDEILAGIRNGSINEAFGCGTAAVVSPIRAFIDATGPIPLPKIDAQASLALRLKDRLQSIQTGQSPDPFGWCHVIKSTR